DRTGKVGGLFRPHDRCAAVTSFASGDIDLGCGINGYSPGRRDRRQRAPAAGIGLIERIGLNRLAALERAANAPETPPPPAHAAPEKIPLLNTRHGLHPAVDNVRNLRKR